MSAPKNRQSGAEFEYLFEREATRQGLYVRKIPLSCRPIGSGRFVPMKSDLDFHLIHKLTALNAFVDTKSFATEKFTFSEIDPQQIKRSVGYNECGVESGFCVLFKSMNTVSYFRGEIIANKGPRSSFHWSQGVYLGSRFDFCLGNLFG